MCGSVCVYARGSYGSTLSPVQHYFRFLDGGTSIKPWHYLELLKSENRIGRGLLFVDLKIIFVESRHDSTELHTFQYRHVSHI